MSRFLGGVTRFQYRITIEGPAIGAGGHRMGFTTPRVRSRRMQRSLYLQL